MAEIFATKTLQFYKDVYEISISERVQTASEANAVFDFALYTAKKENATVLFAELFGGEFLKKPLLEFKKKAGHSFPVNYILPLSENAKPLLASIHIVLGKAEKISFRQSANGNSVVYGNEEFECLRTFGVNGDLPNCTAKERATYNLNCLNNILTENGFCFNDVIRTWFYNQNILDWYGDFNAARTEFFNTHNIFKGLLPASTGIGAANTNNSLIESGLIALKGSKKNISWSVREIPSPLQNSAKDYGSSFSRAVMVCTNTGRRIFVSGTASIFADGQSAYIGDVQKQSRLTRDVILEILKKQNMSFKDCINAVAYCAKPEYCATFEKYLSKEGKIPLCVAYSTVCRSNLLVECELDAFCAE